MLYPYMAAASLERELKRGTAELLVLALLEEEERHGYDIARLIAARSNGVITFHAASLYPTMYRLEAKGLIEGRWVERAATRRRRYYRLTPGGRGVLSKQRAVWATFSAALTRVAGGRDGS